MIQRTTEKQEERRNKAQESDFRRNRIIATKAACVESIYHADYREVKVEQCHPARKPALKKKQTKGITVSTEATTHPKKAVQRSIIYVRSLPTGRDENAGRRDANGNTLRKSP